MIDDSTFTNIYDLYKVKSNHAHFGIEDKPVAIIDGIVHRINEMRSCLEGNNAYVVGVNQDQFQKLCGLIQVTSLYFYEMRVVDLSPLINQSNLARLAIEWNTKVKDLSHLKKLTSLRTLILIDTPKAHDISSFSALDNLTALEFSGGIWNKNTAESLTPISRLPYLQELMMYNIKIESGGILPVAECRSLRYLGLSNHYDTEDFAYLAAHLRNTKCKCFVPWNRLNQPIGDKDIMVTGKRKPLLNSQTDQELMNRYSNDF
jgi:hypothetical protein